MYCLKPLNTGLSFWSVGETRLTTTVPIQIFIIKGYLMYLILRKTNNFEIKILHYLSMLTFNI